jgi:hypothetical protein
MDIKNVKRLNELLELDANCRWWLEGTKELPKDHNVIVQRFYSPGIHFPVPDIRDREVVVRKCVDVLRGAVMGERERIAKEIEAL